MSNKYQTSKNYEKNKTDPDYQVTDHQFSHRRHKSRQIQTHIIEQTIKVTEIQTNVADIQGHSDGMSKVIQL